MALYKAREYKIKQREDASEPELGSLEAFLNPPPHTEAVELDKTELDEAVDSQWELTSGSPALGIVLGQTAIMLGLSVASGVD
ncbi:hypothetical protein Pmar_PMAR013726 [Perkinsus marinus ATCC 50983]|uniref:Uncharacterized protein n=1 Tax=Perkinsus marinus (strain ATCC 50983 / TXsc) TaxID=423536 RepID=C5LY47_PERM5|nr:hypothetical protein Pmar_PMAR013726 [Perkinsus marinus ATCC 50983]EEQ98377.1 hypothetical protein Pmar_PMAR013726 [Perkinsus marinus ATCC 50983]|eukprot:XP_002765660.1 hypothetical protein Pmar_PMAR013726 [Perkinsus marinus ATCC 50983]